MGDTLVYRVQCPLVNIQKTMVSDPPYFSWENPLSMAIFNSYLSSFTKGTSLKTPGAPTGAQDRSGSPGLGQIGRSGSHWRRDRPRHHPGVTDDWMTT